MNVYNPGDWIGRSEQCHEPLSSALVKRVAATLGEKTPEPGEALPPLWHWAFFQPAFDECSLGKDGHPVRTAVLPPNDGRNRMWAGGRIEFFEPLRVDGEATRVTSLIKLEEKAGHSGPLLFATLRHDYLQGAQLCLREEQDIVYREPSVPKLFSAQPTTAGDWREVIEPTPALLFRYSAITFNSHRIHYDWPYATGVEGYPGLVVHGPLIASLNLQAFCRANPQARPRHFAYRGIRPLIAPQPFDVGGRIVAPGKAELWAANDAGIAQHATLTFD